MDELKKELYKYKLDLLYYGISISRICYTTLRKGKNNQININDYITTKGLMIALEFKIYVHVNLNKDSQYKSDILNNTYVLKYKDVVICHISIIQPPDFALQITRLRGLYINLELYNDNYRKNIFPKKTLLENKFILNLSA